MSSKMLFFRGDDGEPHHLHPNGTAELGEVSALNLESYADCTI